MRLAHDVIFLGTVGLVETAHGEDDVYPLGWNGAPRSLRRGMCALFGVHHYDDVFERLVRMDLVRPITPILKRRIAKPILDRRLLFIHVPKNGGTSISTALYGGSPGHKTAWFYRCAAPEFYKAASPMAVLRDPVERFLSAYWFIRRGGGDKVIVKPAFARLMRSIATVDQMLDFVEGGSAASMTLITCFGPRPGMSPIRLAP